MAGNGTNGALEPPTEDELRLLELLSGGLTDDAAAARLGWNPRTLRRRLRTAMEKLGARSRFEAGFLFARSGWPGVGAHSERRFWPGGGLNLGDPYAGRQSRGVERL